MIIFGLTPNVCSSKIITNADFLNTSQIIFTIEKKETKEAGYLEERMTDCGVALHSYGQGEVDGA
jgi:hypothetical protein